MEIFTIAFFGHRYLTDFFTIERWLEELIRSLMNEHKYAKFLVGRNDEFDQMVTSTVHRTKPL